MINNELLPVVIALVVVVFVFLLGFLAGISANLDKITDEYENALKSYEELSQSCISTMEEYKKTLTTYQNILRSRK